MLFIQKCQNCNAQFSWSKIYKSFLWTYKPIKCSECGTIHKITIPGRIIFVSLTIVPMLIFANFLSPFSNLIATLTIGILILIIGSLLTPFFVTYKKSF
ncbi:TIGR04104 family putative zinc finger protein [Virgibacillus sp. W0181]|uniref:TIGR04104 family putative zinc finger protein n=1 Tax=Virgibacillus sp. W0181 TaxID=3391581 RepID=UPI003F45327D